MKAFFLFLKVTAIYRQGNECLYIVTIHFKKRATQVKMLLFSLYFLCHCIIFVV